MSKSCPFSLLFSGQSAVGAAPAEGARGPQAGVRQAPRGGAQQCRGPSLNPGAISDAIWQTIQ